MAGAYCKFCGRRCFVYRIVPDGPSKGWGGHMATCTDGMVLDLEVLGHTHLTAVNPITEPEAADAIAAELAGERGRQASEIAAEAGQATFTWFADRVNTMLPDPAQAPALDQMTDADWLSVARELRRRPQDHPLVRTYWDQAGEALPRD